MARIANVTRLDRLHGLRARRVPRVNEEERTRQDRLQARRDAHAARLEEEDEASHQARLEARRVARATSLEDEDEASH